MQEYDENEAIKAINKALVEAGRSSYDDDQLLNIIDMIWDYYEENGLLDIDDDFEADEDEDIASELIDYIKRMLRKDSASSVNTDDLRIIVDAELDYEDSTLNEI